MVALYHKGQIHPALPLKIGHVADVIIHHAPYCCLKAQSGDSVGTKFCLASSLVVRSNSEKCYIADVLTPRLVNHRSTEQS